MVLPTMFATTNISMPSCCIQVSTVLVLQTKRHADLPPATLVRRSPLIVVVLLFLEQMRLALQGQADALDAGGGEANDYTDLLGAVRYLYCGRQRVRGGSQRCWRPRRAPPCRSRRQRSHFVAATSSAKTCCAERRGRGRGCAVCVQRRRVSGCVTVRIGGKPRDRGLGGRCAGGRDARCDDVGCQLDRRRARCRRCAEDGRRSAALETAVVPASVQVSSV